MMQKQKINSKTSAKKLGAYSHGYSVDVGDSKIIFTTGQIALNENGEVMYPDDISKQTEYVYESLNSILNEVGASLDDVVKTTIYLTDMKDFPLVSQVRNKYLHKSEPASTLVEVSKLVKEGCKVEIEVIAIIKN